MRRRTLLTTTLGWATALLAGCQRLVRGNQIVRDRGCSGDVLDETNLASERVTIQTWSNAEGNIPDGFPHLDAPPTITFDGESRRVVIRTLVPADNYADPEDRRTFDG